MTLEWTGSAVLEPGNAVYDPAADRWLSLPAVRATVLSSRLVLFIAWEETGIRDAICAEGAPHA